MRTIHCHIPITVRVTGRPTDAQLDALVETLARAVAGRIALAERTVADARRDPAPARAAAARAGYDAARDDAAADGYHVPSYDDSGRLTVIRLRRRLPRGATSGAVARGRVRVPTGRVRWLLDLNPDAPWLTALGVDITEAAPEVDVTVELIRARDGSLTAGELTADTERYLQARHAGELAATPHFAFALLPLDAVYRLQSDLGVRADDLFAAAGLPSPRQQRVTGFNGHVLLVYASFPRELEQFVPEEITFADGDTITAGVSAAAIARAEPGESPADLIDRFTSWGNLDEDGLGAFLVALTRQSPAAAGYVRRVFDELGTFNRDDVALAFAAAATDADLDRLTHAPPVGPALLERLYDEITGGSIGGDEQPQAARLLAARARYTSVEDAAEQLAAGRVRYFFPFKLPGPTVFDAAPITASVRPGGRVRVKLPMSVRGSATYREQTRTLPLAAFTGDGMELDAGEWVRVRMYDEGDAVVTVPALYLVELGNRSTTRTGESIAAVAAFALSFGVGGGAAAGGTAARASLGARALAFLDRAAAVLGVLGTIVRDHRGWIIRTFGENGRRFVRAVEIAEALAGVYGLARVAIAAPRIISNVRTSWRAWRDSRAYSALAGDDLARAEQMSRQTQEFVQHADDAAAAAGPQARADLPDVPDHPPTAADVPERPPVAAEQRPDIGRMIDEELERGGRPPPAGTEPLDLGGPPPPARPRRPVVARAADVDMSDLTDLNRARYVEGWKTYKGAIRTRAEYIRTRHGYDTGQLARDAGGGSFERAFPGHVGRLAERVWERVLGTPRNPGATRGGRFDTPHGNVDPDFAPAVDAAGNAVFARNRAYAAANGVPGIDDALLVADSKYIGVFDDVATLNFGRFGDHADQVRGMIWLSQFTKSKTFVFLGRSGQRVGQGILDFARELGVTVRIEANPLIQ